MTRFVAGIVAVPFVLVIAAVFITAALLGLVVQLGYFILDGGEPRERH